VSGDGAQPARRLVVNPLLCDGAGYCAEIVPELIGLDDWGYPMLRPAPLDDETVLRHATRAVAQCPRAALMLTRAADRG